MEPKISELLRLLANPKIEDILGGLKNEDRELNATAVLKRRAVHHIPQKAHKETR